MSGNAYVESFVLLFVIATSGFQREANFVFSYPLSQQCPSHSLSLDLIIESLVNLRQSLAHCHDKPWEDIANSLNSTYTLYRPEPNHLEVHLTLGER